MKKNLFMVMLFALAFSLTSCQKETIYTYYYENRSSYDIVIENYGWTGIEYIDVPDNEDYEYIYIYRSFKPVTDPPFYMSTKVRLIFDGRRVLTWHSSTIPNEGIYGNNYRQMKTGKYSYDMFFTFTPEMYDEAVPIMDE